MAQVLRVSFFSFSPRHSAVAFELRTCQFSQVDIQFKEFLTQRQHRIIQTNKQTNKQTTEENNKEEVTRKQRVKKEEEWVAWSDS